MEYTARVTPQQNSIVEKKFDTLYCRGKAMMNAANVPLHKRYILFREVLHTATLLDGLRIIELNGKEATRFEHWNGEITRFAYHLRIWGEAGVVKLKQVGAPKLEDRGKICMMVGYATNHAGDCYHMYDDNTQRVHVTRDITWLDKMYFNADSSTPKVEDEYVMGYDLDDNDINVKFEDRKGNATGSNAMSPNSGQVQGNNSMTMGDMQTFMNMYY